MFRKIPGDRESILRLIKRFMLEVNKYYLELPFIDWLESLAHTVDEGRTVDRPPTRRVGALLECTTTDSRWSVPRGSTFLIHRGADTYRTFKLKRTSVNRSMATGKPHQGLLFELIDEWPLFYHIDACWTWLT